MSDQSVRDAAEQKYEVSRVLIAWRSSIAR
jgi:hypothetical protein